MNNFTEKGARVIAEAITQGYLKNVEELYDIFNAEARRIQREIKHLPPEQMVMTAGATADPVKDYLKQIGRVALLNAELEVELATRMEAGLFAEEKLATDKKIDKKFWNEIAKAKEEKNKSGKKRGKKKFSNIGGFGNLMGTPIIVQPQVGILAFGLIEKKASVVSRPEGDSIEVRQKMFISHSYDHRIIDGNLGGGFLKRVSDYLEKFNYPEEI